MNAKEKAEVSRMEGCLRMAENTRDPLVVLACLRNAVASGLKVAAEGSGEARP